ncbi:ATP-binding protein [Nocardia crassostreae]|uniref:ATP-binding protein n=1 Tax=Nocardia crassostreae TaxID=53428 RepID=UPI001C3FAA5A|nr:LuxR C-terminal-related transcriptional regulator [Nocardia crassostreae]
MSKQKVSAGISDREAEVLTLVGQHRSNAEIAAELYISVRTVETHVSSLLRKVGVPDRRALAGRAAELTRAEPDSETVAVLPSPLTSFVGRATERAALREAVAAQRHVTALGPGGVGKTRLALAVAADLAGEFADGAWFVDLVPVTDPDMAGAAVARALGVGEQPGRGIDDSVLTVLAGRHTLLVLDNCDHLREGIGPFIERLLTDCPRVTVLATSRARLMVPTRYRRSPWTIPPPMPSHCSWTGPPPWAGRWIRNSTTRFRRSAIGSTGSPCPSNSPPPDCPPSAWTAWPRASPIHCACSSAAAAPTTGTARCGPCWTGVTPC